MFNNIYIRRWDYAEKTIVLLPETEKILEQMGLQIKYARLRRKLTSNWLRKEQESAELL